jgi:hypothetical protein
VAVLGGSAPIAGGVAMEGQEAIQP